jgi:hypothetical protein
MNKNNDKNSIDTNAAKNSCDQQLSREEFLKLVVKRAAIAGTIIAAPKVVDKFLVPPAHAVTSTLHAHVP